ncbi:MAG: lipopolysaccharide biosynthesis protein [Candidatus Binatia bacterium]
MIKQAIAKGAVWMVLFKLADRSLGLVSVVILARLLVPADFGLVAMAMAIIAFIDIATSLSFDIALIQKSNPSREHYDTAWTLNIAVGVGCGLVIAALAYPAASFYNEPRLAAIMLVLAISWLLQGFENIGVVNFRREMNFAREFRFMAGKRVAGFVVTLTLALTLQSYWALIAGTVVSRFAGVLLSYAMQPFRPRFSLAASRDLFSFSGWLLLNNILGATLGNIPLFFIGRVQGPRELGIYTVGHEIAFLPSTELVAPINRAVLPGYARMATIPENLRNGYVEVIAAVLTIALPASFGLAAVADPLVQVMLGDKWLAAIPIIQILAFGGAIAAMQSNNYSAYIALGQQRVLVLIMAAHLIVVVPLMFFLGARFGIQGVAFAELLAGMVSLVVSYPVLFRTLKISVSNYAKNIWRPLLAAAVMGFTVYSLVGELTQGAVVLAPWLQLAVLVPAGAAIYIATLGAFWLVAGKPIGAETVVLARLKEALLQFKGVLG